MYKTLFLLLFALPVISHAQDDDDFKLPVDSLTNKVTYSEVIKVDSTTAKDLYSRAKYFIANAFKNANAVSMLQDEATTTLVCKGNMKAYVKSMGLRTFGVINFTLTIICKDGRYKYTLTDLVHENITVSGSANGGNLENEKAACGGMTLPKKNWEQIKSYAHGDIFLLTEELKKTMLTNTKSDW